MVPAMFGMGGTEILVILVVALLFLGPDKLPEAAKQISKGIRDIKKQSRALQQTIEDDEHIGGAIRDLKSALRGEDAPARPIKPPELPPAAETIALPATTSASDHAAVVVAAAGTHAQLSDDSDYHATGTMGDSAGRAIGPAADLGPVAGSEAEATAPSPANTVAPSSTANDRPTITLPPSVGERDPDEERPSEHDAAELAALVRPAPHTIARGAKPAAAPAAVEPADASDATEPKHG